MNRWRWWFERPWRLLAGIVLVAFIGVIFYQHRHQIVVDVVTAAALVIIIRFALTGRVGRGGGH